MCFIIIRRFGVDSKDMVINNYLIIKLLTPDIIKKFDSNEMLKAYDRWPEIAKNAYNSKVEPVDFKNIGHIVFAGMGGSGAISDIFSSILSLYMIPFFLSTK